MKISERCQTKGGITDELVRGVSIKTEGQKPYNQRRERGGTIFDWGRVQQQVTFFTDNYRIRVELKAERGGRDRNSKGRVVEPKKNKKKDGCIRSITIISREKLLLRKQEEKKRDTGFAGKDHPTSKVMKQNVGSTVVNQIGREKEGREKDKASCEIAGGGRG